MSIINACQAVSAASVIEVQLFRRILARKIMKSGNDDAAKFHHVRPEAHHQCYDKPLNL